MKQNAYWMSRLQGAKLLGLDPITHFGEREKRIANVTVANVKEMFVKVLPDEPVHHSDPTAGAEVIGSGVARATRKLRTTNYEQRTIGWSGRRFAPALFMPGLKTRRYDRSQV